MIGVVSQAIGAWMASWILGGAVSSRARSALTLATSWRRRPRRARSSWVSASGRGRGAGVTASAQCAMTRAALRSVVARIPTACAQARRWRGWTTTTGRAAATRAATSGPWEPPVASRTIRVGAKAPRRMTSASMPGASLGALHVSAVGRTAMSRVALATSIPTKRGDGTRGTSCMLARPCRIRAPWALATVRAAPGADVPTHAHPRSLMIRGATVWHVSTSCWGLPLYVNQTHS